MIRLMFIEERNDGKDNPLSKRWRAKWGKERREMRERGINRERDRNRETETETDRERDRDRQRERERREKEKDRNRQRERERESW